LGGKTEDVILVEKSSLVDMKKIVLHMTDRMRRYLLDENGTSKLEIYRISDFQNPRNGNNELVQVSTPLFKRLSNGRLLSLVVCGKMLELAVLILEYQLGLTLPKLTYANEL